jgi:hypothetical protein
VGSVSCSSRTPATTLAVAAAAGPRSVVMEGGLPALSGVSGGVEWGA